MSKQQLADKASVSLNTLNRWCKPFQQELEALGLQPRAKMLPPVVVKFIECLPIVRIMLMYYIDVMGFLEHPEKDWEVALEEVTSSPPAAE